MRWDSIPSHRSMTSVWLPGWSAHRRSGLAYILEGSLPQVKSSGHERVLAMPVREDGESFKAFNGKIFRQIGVSGMSM